MKYDKSGFVDLGPIKDEIPVNEGIMPVSYGYILGTINKEEKEEQKEELDALVLSENKFSIGGEVEIEPIALLEREDKDHKIVAREIGSEKYATWADIPEEEMKLLLDYFGYKSPITHIGTKEEALKLIQKSSV